MKRPPPHLGFSLVEVVIALGIATFAGMALLGMFSLGINVNKGSIDELEATHIAQSLLAKRRAAPTGAGLLSPLGTPSSVTGASPIFLNAGGEETAGAEEAKYGLVYTIQPTTGARTSQVYLCIYWPAVARAEMAQGRVELYSIIPL